MQACKSLGNRRYHYREEEEQYGQCASFPDPSSVRCYKISGPQQLPSLRSLVSSTGTSTASSSSSLTGLVQQAHIPPALLPPCSWVLGQGPLGLASWALIQTPRVIPSALQKGQMRGVSARHPVTVSCSPGMGSSLSYNPRSHTQLEGPSHATPRHQYISAVSPSVHCPHGKRTQLLHTEKAHRCLIFLLPWSPSWAPGLQLVPLSVCS